MEPTQAGANGENPEQEMPWQLKWDTRETPGGAYISEDSWESIQDPHNALGNPGGDLGGVTYIIRLLCHTKVPSQRHRLAFEAALAQQLGAAVEGAGANMPQPDADSAGANMPQPDADSAGANMPQPDADSALSDNEEDDDYDDFDARSDIHTYGDSIVAGDWHVTEAPGSAWSVTNRSGERATMLCNVMNHTGSKAERITFVEAAEHALAVAGITSGDVDGDDGVECDDSLIIQVFSVPRNVMRVGRSPAVLIEQQHEVWWCMRLVATETDRAPALCVSLHSRSEDGVYSLVARAIGFTMPFWEVTETSFAAGFGIELFEVRSDLIGRGLGKALLRLTESVTVEMFGPDAIVIMVDCDYNSMQFYMHHDYEAVIDHCFRIVP